MAVISILVGLVLLTLGRRLFWLFVAGIGFVAAMAIANRFLDTPSDWLVIGIALAGGFVGAILALFVQKLAIGLAGFLAGGFLALGILDLLAIELGAASWGPFLAGAIVGALAAYPLFDWALIVLSSLAGALLIAQSLDLERLLAVAVLGLAFVFGVAVQAGVYSRVLKRRREAS